jgi:hypothetical protein
MWWRRLALVLAVVIASAAVVAGQTPPPGAPSAAPKPVEVPVPPEVVAELQQALTEAIRRFEAMDEEGVLANVSDRYRSGPLTKTVVRQQLRAMFAAHDAVRARVRIGEIRIIGDRAWVSSSGDVTGRLRFLGTPIAILGWTDAWDVAWRENGRWRLIGDKG